jgi:hypothetical protein
LGDNGGQTPTYALPATSPAVDTGDTDQASDQRGIRRPQGSADDIGAVELQQDTTPPDTIIDSGPAQDSVSTSTSATFTFHASESGSTLECRLDAGAYADCDSGTQTYDSLTPGAHTFSVRATDVAGNADPSPATRDWRVHARPSITTTASGSTAAGGSVSADAELVDGFAATGNVTFALYGPDDPACSGQPMARIDTPLSSGHAESGAAQVTQAGTYHWIASYAGDDNNEPAASTCNDAAVLITAGPVAVITLAPASATVLAGTPQTYTATGTDEFGNPTGDITGQVEFSIDPDGSCAGAICTPTAAGTHTVTATLGAAAAGSATLIVTSLPASSSAPPNATPPNATPPNAAAPPTPGRTTTAPSTPGDTEPPASTDVDGVSGQELAATGPSVPPRTALALAGLLLALGLAVLAATRRRGVGRHR